MRQIVLQATSSLKSPAFWPEPPRPYPVGATKWETMSIVIEGLEDSPDFKLFEERFKALQGPRFHRNSIENADNNNDENEDNEEELTDINSEDIFIGSTAMMVKAKATKQVSATEAKLANTQNVRTSRSETVTIDGETPPECTVNSRREGGQMVLKSVDKDNSYEELEGIVVDSDTDIDEDTLAKYGGFPAIPEISTRFEVAAGAIVDEDVCQGLKELDEEEREMEKEHPWIKIVDGSEYYDEGADLYSKMGVVARAAYDLALLNATNKEYERVIVGCIGKMDRNQQLMNDLEKARKVAIENEHLYAHTRSGYRQATNDMLVVKKASMAFTAKPMPSYLSTATEVKKRKIGEERSVALFGSKPGIKKIRTTSAMPLAEGSKTTIGEKEGLKEMGKTVKAGKTSDSGDGGEVFEVSGKTSMDEEYITTQTEARESGIVVFEE